MSITPVCSFLQLPREIRNAVYEHYRDSIPPMASFGITWPLLDMTNQPFEVRELDMMLKSKFITAEQQARLYGILENSLAYTCQQIFEEYKHEYKTATGHMPYVAIDHRANGWLWETPVEHTSALETSNQGKVDDTASFHTCPGKKDRTNLDATHLRVHFEQSKSCYFGPNLVGFLRQCPNLQVVDFYSHGELSKDSKRSFFVHKMVKQCNTYLAVRNELATIRIGWDGVEEIIVLRRKECGKYQRGTSGAGVNNLWPIAEAVDQHKRIELEIEKRLEMEARETILRLKINEIKEIMAKNREDTES